MLGTNSFFSTFFFANSISLNCCLVFLSVAFIIFSLMNTIKAFDENNYDDEDYEEDDENDYDDDPDGEDETNYEGNALALSSSSSGMQQVSSTNHGQRPRSTQSDPASTPTRRQSRQRVSLSYSDNESSGTGKVEKKKSKSAKGKQAHFIVTKPKRSVAGDRPGDWTDSDDEEDRRLERKVRWSHVPSRFPIVGTKNPSQAPRVPEGSQREGTPLAMLSLAENARVLGLFQQRY
jgi:hypothetical protein